MLKKCEGKSCQRGMSCLHRCKLKNLCTLIYCFVFLEVKVARASFLNKVLAQTFSYKFCEIFKNTLFS